MSGKRGSRVPSIEHGELPAPRTSYAKNNLRQQDPLFEAKFVKEYLVDYSPAGAATRCGISPGAAHRAGLRLLVRLRDKIELEHAKRLKKVDLTAESVLLNIRRIASLAEEKDDLGVALKACELEGKYLKMFTDKIAVEGSLSLEALVCAHVPEPPAVVVDSLPSLPEGE